ncbi:glucose-6-phosphate isomerase [Asimina triloba]
MASISGMYSPSSTFKPSKSLLHKPSVSPIFRTSFQPRSDWPFHLRPSQCIAKDVQADLSAAASAAVEKKGLEKDPFALWRRYVDWLYQHKELGLFLDVSRIGFTDEFLDQMEPRLQKAFRDMQDLERGAIANPDEGRMVGHYWLRSPHLAPKPILKTQIEKTLDAVCRFAEDVISGKIKPPSSLAGRFTQILSVGIGGSALGPQFVAEALAPDNPPLKIRFIDNTDPAGIDHQIAQLGDELASTLVIVISKSGGTPETRNGLLEVQKAFREAGLDFSKQGIDVREMLAGAALMDEASRTTVDMVVLPYKDSLLLFSRYLQQLVMESLGKEFDLDGNRHEVGLRKSSADIELFLLSSWELRLIKDLVSMAIKGAQINMLLRDRPPGHDWELEPGVTCGDYLFGMLQGTRAALYANNRESITVTVQEVTPRSTGALIALYERAVGIYASLVNINAYHQPGVEAGKKAAGEVLALQKRVLSVLNEASCKEPVEPLTLDEIADRCHATEQIEMIYKIIGHMAANDRAIIAEGSCGSPRSIKVFLGECNVDELYA